MPKLSAGILLYRRTNQTKIEVFLVHPGGPFWAKKDNGAWSLPKGEYSKEEKPLDAAKREFNEETGIECPIGKFIELGEVKYSNKLLSAWGLEGNCDESKIKSNFFEMQWPPKTGRMQQFAEVDRAGWFSPAIAKKKLVAGQVPLLDNLLTRLKIETPEANVNQLSMF